MSNKLLFVPDDEAEDDDEEEAREEDGGAILTTSATATTPFDVLWADSKGRAPVLAFVMLANTAV